MNDDEAERRQAWWVQWATKRDYTALLWLEGAGVVILIICAFVVAVLLKEAL